MRLALAFLLLATPALADMSLPPPQFDIGGGTEAEVIVNMIDRFGPGAPPLIRVLPHEVAGECDRIQMTRYREHYPAAETADGSTLIGCLIRDWDFGNPVIVYAHRPLNPGLAPQLLRHELGHMLGWAPNHER